MMLGFFLDAGRNLHFHSQADPFPVGALFMGIFSGQIIFIYIWKSTFHN